MIFISYIDLIRCFDKMYFSPREVWHMMLILSLYLWYSEKRYWSESMEFDEAVVNESEEARGAMM